jgi:hypothetical protein
MNNSELDQLLKAASPPERAPELWDTLPKRITARLHWQPKRDAASLVEPRRFLLLFQARVVWALGATVVGLAVALVFFALPHPRRLHSGSQLATVGKCFREIEALFPNQVRAVVFDERGARIILAEQADVPDSPPLYLKICGPNGCERVVTFSGQQIWVNGDACDVLQDADGNVLLVGDNIAWSSASVNRDMGRYHIEARPLGTSS